MRSQDQHTDRNTVRAYHERTKHRLDAYARGPEYLDWEHQPDPFRRFSGAPVQTLPLSPDPARGVAVLDLNGISKLLELSMGISAWKAFGPHRWALRCNPSSGNLHPTEAYIICRQVTGLKDGVYHYAPREHALERRAHLSPASDQSFCLLGLSSIFWREAWKYGERAFRYVQLDVGHALAAVRYAAAVLGWRVSLLSVTDNQIAELLGLNRPEDFTGAEAEHPDLLLQISPYTDSYQVEIPTAYDWMGQANRLGGEPCLAWPIIDQVHLASECSDGIQISNSEQTRVSTDSHHELARLIRQRRSAQSFIGEQSWLQLSAFERLLRAVSPVPHRLPWDIWPLPPRLHPVLFVHRVEGVEPGLYALPRRSEAVETLQAAMDSDFAWEPITGLAADTSLYRLISGDMRKMARLLACHQEIASASSFSLAMLAEYDSALEQSPCNYRHLHWEAGMIGQALYLEAEAVGMRGTGIGCFFDDSVHQSLGIEDTRLQSLYHFTVGSPRLDRRLQTLPAYGHRE